MAEKKPTWRVIIQMENSGAGRIRLLIPGWISTARRVPWHSALITTDTASHVWDPGELTKADSLLGDKIRSTY